MSCKLLNVLENVTKINDPIKFIFLRRDHTLAILRLSLDERDKVYHEN